MEVHQFATKVICFKGFSDNSNILPHLIPVSVNRKVVHNPLLHKSSNVLMHIYKTQ